MQAKLVLALVPCLVAACAQMPMAVETAEAPLTEATMDTAASAAEPPPAVLPPVSRPPASLPIAYRPSRPEAMDLLERKLQAAAEAAATADAAEAAIVAAPAAPPPPPPNIWDRIRAGFALPALENDLVREWENYYASRPEYLARMIARSSHFLFHIVEQIEKRNMPLEIALLPMIESAYNPVAYSTAHASGIWQFIPSTGRHYGLRQNWWYDGRRDVIAATDAALEYLQRLHGMFNDWQLALASYNWGEGAVGRALERNRARGLPAEYESLTMPAETRNYIPKLIAVKNIIANPARYGVIIADVPNAPYFETVRVKRHIDMKLAARLAGMQLDEFRFLNPGHNKPVIKAGEAERIVLPKERVEVFLANLEKHDKPLVSWNTVKLQKGQRPEKVAAEHGITLLELKEVNGLKPGRRMAVGQPLLVPVKGGIENPHLPDLPVTPVTLPRALAAARNAAPAGRSARAGQNTRTAQKPRSKPPQRRAQQAKPPATRAAASAPAPAARSNGKAPAAQSARVQSEQVVRTSTQQNKRDTEPRATKR